MTATTDCPICLKSLARSSTDAYCSEACRSASFQRIYLKVPFAEKDKAKAAGARWDNISKRWYVSTTNSSAWKWMPEHLKQPAKPSKVVAPPKIKRSKVRRKKHAQAAARKTRN